jgi:hypothetical protein
MHSTIDFTNRFKKDSESRVYLVNGDKEDLMHDKPTEGQDLNGEINGSDIIDKNLSCTNHCNESFFSSSFMIDSESAFSSSFTIDSNSSSDVEE